MNKLGFIGTGNMGTALAKAASRISDNKISLANKTVSKAEALAQLIGAEVSDNKSIAKDADFIYIGVRPAQLADLAEEIKPVLDARTDRFVLVSMAAGTSIERLKSLFGDYPVLRIMPNTAISIGAGLIVYANDGAADEEVTVFCESTKEAGLVVPIAEDKIDAAAATFSCSPAYAALFAKGLADGGVACGLTREQAVEMAAQTLVGTGRLILETGVTPEEVADEVSTPGGSTIEGTKVFEASDFNEVIINAVKAAYNKMAGGMK